MNLIEADAEGHVGIEVDTALDEQAVMKEEEEHPMKIVSSCAFSSAPSDYIQFLQEQLKIVLAHLPLAVFFFQAPRLCHHCHSQCLRVLQPFCLLCWCMMVVHNLAVAAAGEHEEMAEGDGWVIKLNRMEESQFSLLEKGDLIRCQVQKHSLASRLLCADF